MRLKLTRHFHFPSSAHLNSVARHTSGYHTNRGFSLIEVGVVIFIITMVLGSILIPLSTQVEQKQINDTQTTMDQIKEALLGFVTANGYLPCPDTTGDGVADPNTPNACPNAEGFVPWTTLNVTREDAWGNRFRYRVTPEFTNTPASGTCATGDGRLGLCDSGNIRIDTPNPTTKTAQILVSNAAAIILSHGKNGYGATSANGSVKAAPPALNANETTNTSPVRLAFISRTAVGVRSDCNDSAAGQPFCEFDDIVTWISAYSIFNRLVAAGKLP